jgi:hypothetical protein
MKVMTIAEAQAAFDKVLESLADDSIVLKGASVTSRR